MQDCKPVSPLPVNFKLSSNMILINDEERMEMYRVLYASVVESLIFTIICTRPDIAHVMEVATSRTKYI